MDPTAAELPIVTARLVLRRLVPGDAADVTRLVNDYSVAGNLARVPFPYREQLALDWIASAGEQIDSGDAYHLAITREGALVGCIGLTLKRNALPEIGYWIGRKFWGQHLAREAGAALLGWAERSLGIKEVEASALTDNLASQSVLRHLGFVENGPGVQQFLSRNRNMPVVMFRRVAAPPKPPAAKPILLVVACALVDSEGRILLAQRPAGKPMAGLWEFPGGKLDEGETPEAALIRELREELSIETQESCLSPLFFASHSYEKFHLLMPLYICRKWQGRVVATEGQALAWVRPGKLADYPMPPADVPLVALLRDFL
ncbi:bifunctional GNAT family N-acetyltransferase/(deoxy)nucleoside triphosphate pyrophosphohydrolase [Roseococcus sp. SYP-B2431]|uniref:bifunctional GNAT family N-acetyltransferase/(deoxy)nucleoside triphosphate pyrophosphohydrolase n=1 Tax=Roseococcus sp. SYP-B2431 TaxID=2496640 RepID=UPI001F0EEB58|nr:bifunctional GNAT family N-acetyltransferase/(deoxy)nucleoside triphosphate pyrophosphohydrolase [Roseococcus sp. SYP-B2431]